MSQQIKQKRPLPQGTDLITFFWTVAPGACESTGVRPPKGPSSGTWDYQAIWERPFTGEARRYSPITEHPALFRTFADLEVGTPADEPTAMLAFANEYGLLGVEKRVRKLDGSKVGKEIMAEPIFGGGHDDDCWADAIYSMRTAVSLLDALIERDAEALSPFVEWEPNELQEVQVRLDRDFTKRGRAKRIFVPPNVTSGFGVSRGGLVHQYGLVKGDPFGPIRMYLRHQVNEHIAGHVSARLIFDPENDNTEMQFVPDSLLSAMWFQLGKALTGNRQYRACEECGKWFEVSTDKGGVTKRKQYCGDPCRMAAYRHRKERAVALAEDGMKPEQIAKELDSDPQTVQGWIKKAKEDKRK